MQAQQSSYLSEQSKYKIVILGESSVGKTSIVQYIVHGKHENVHQPTVYLDSVKKNIMYNGHMLRLTFWDTAGQEKFNSLVPSAIRSAHCAILVYDVNDIKSFERLTHWLNMIKNNNDKKQCPVVLVGNKTDLGTRSVSKEQGFDFAVSYKMTYVQTSAMNGNGVQNLISQIIQCLQSKTEKSTKSSEDSKKYLKASTKLKQTEVKLKKEGCTCCSI